MTDPSSTCPDCGTALPEDSPQQLCPSCLLKQAFASRTIDAEGSPPPEPPPSPEEIADKFPQFEVTECLGRGGMGVVYKARQKSLNRWVAIKILAPERVGDEKFAERFSREAQTLALLNHPNIVTVFDYGETDGLYYIVMEFVDGVNLRDLLRDGKIESAQALTIVPPICEALQYAHDKGIVHRDIKPENLLIDRDGRVKIADFGIASLVGATGESSGTPPYMAPEQGAHTDVDHRADIYALGAVLYEMLTGDRPASPLDLPSKKVQLDIRIDDIVLRALSKEPERRYRTANEFQTVVESITPDKAQSAQSMAVPQAGGSAPKRGMLRRWWWIMLSLVIAGPAIGFFGASFMADLPPKTFEATAAILIRPLDNGEGISRSQEELFSKLLSTENLSGVADRHELPKRWASSKGEVIQRLKESIQLIPRPGADLIEINVRTNDRELTKNIANSLAEVSVSNLSSARVHIVSKANEPYPIVTLERRVKVGVPIGLLLAPLLALAIMAILQRAIPDRGPSVEAPDLTEEQKAKNSFYGKIALWLFLAAILGTLAMMTLSSRDEMALIFGGIALFCSLVFGLLSRSRGVVIALILVTILAAVSAVISAIVLYFMLGKIEKSIALEEEQRARMTDQIAQIEEAKREASSELEQATADSLETEESRDEESTQDSAIDPSLIPLENPTDGAVRKYSERYRILTDLDGDGVEDMLLSGGPQLFGTMGGPWIVYLSRDDEFVAVGELGDLLAHPLAIAIEPDHARFDKDPKTRRYARVWVYLKASGSAGSFGYFRVGEDSIDEMEKIEIYPGDGGTVSGNAIYEEMFKKKSPIPFSVEYSTTDDAGKVSWEKYKR